MRFSLKWLLVLVAYVAVACASVVYASTAWRDVVAAAGLAAACGAVMGIVLGRGVARAFGVGFLVVAVALGLGVVVEAPPAADFVQSVDRWAVLLAAQIRDQETAIEEYVAGEFPNSPGRLVALFPNDRGGVIARFEGLAPRTPSPVPGTLNIGSPRTEIGIPASVVRALPARDDVASTIRQHIFLLTSLIGGASAVWLQRRQMVRYKTPPAPAATHSPISKSTDRPSSVETP